MTPTPDGARCSGRRRRVGRLRGVRVVVVGCVLQRRWPRLVDRPRVGLSVIPSPRWAAWSAATGSRWAGSIRGATTPVTGGHDLPRPAPTTSRARLMPPRCSRRCRPGGGCVRRAARRRPARSARRAAATTPMLRPRRAPTCSRTAPEPGVRGHPLHGLDRGPAHQPAPCLVIRPRCTVVSDSWCFGVSPAQRGQLRGPVEPGDVADLGDEHRRQHRPDPRDLPGSPGSRGGCAAGPATSLANSSISKSSVVDQPQRGVRPGPATPATARPGQQLLPADAEQVAHRHLHAGAGEHARGPGTSVRPQPDQLGPVAHQLAQLPGGRRGDPRLGQPAHPQQISQIRARRARRSSPAAYENIFTPSGCARCTLRAQLGQRVRGPVVG